MRPTMGNVNAAFTKYFEEVKRGICIRDSFDLLRYCSDGVGESVLSRLVDAVACMNYESLPK